MRVLVLSDTHGGAYTADRIIGRHDDIKHIFFLGDGISDIEYVMENHPDRNYYVVSGNCDFSSSYKNTAIVTLENTRILLTHGNRHGVKYSTEHIKQAAKEQNCTLVLFGHTHCSVTAYDDGIYLVNPGSLSSPRDGVKSYAIIDITPSGIMPSLMPV